MKTSAGDAVAVATGERTLSKAMTLLAAFILVNAVLLTPWWVLSGGFAAPWLALEAGLVVGAFALLGRAPWVRVAAYTSAGLLVLLSLVGIGDTAMRLGLGRPLNLYLDFWLLSAVKNLLDGTLGAPLATASLVVLPVALVGLVLGIGRLLAALPDGGEGRPSVLGPVALAAFLVGGLAVERVPALAPVVDVPTVRLVGSQVTGFAEARGQEEWFAEKLADIPESYADQPGLLARLAGRDVILGFLESYGVAAVFDPRYASVVGPRLDDFERRMDEAGLHVATGKLVAPSQGGQSWFAHGSILSGIWLDNQLRYDMMLASGRETLIEDFRRAGHSAVAVMPAITTAWPEGERFGYDRIYTRPEIDYEGPPLNWVTMPDQFTWSFFERAVREPAEGPIFAELGLISSHAPWTPILPVLDDWGTIGDGRVFDRFADAGERPDELWRDTDRVREHYALSIEYAVHVLIAYAERHVDENTLLIVLGDHQPAPLITGEGASWDVPVHVVSGDRALVAPFLRWGFVEGARPPEHAGTETLGVDYFRDWFVRAYSGS